MCEELSCQSSPSEKNLLNPSISINFFQPTPAQAAILSYVDHSHSSLTTPQHSFVLLQSILYKAIR